MPVPPIRKRLGVNARPLRGGLHDSLLGGWNADPRLRRVTACHTRRPVESVHSQTKFDRVVSRRVHPLVTPMCPAPEFPSSDSGISLPPPTNPHDEIGR